MKYDIQADIFQFSQEEQSLLGCNEVVAAVGASILDLVFKASNNMVDPAHTEEDKAKNERLFLMRRQLEQIGRRVDPELFSDQL